MKKNKYNRKVSKMIRTHQVHKDEYPNAFDDLVTAKLISDLEGKAWYIKDLGHPTKQIKQLWEGGKGIFNFTTQAQSLARYKKANGIQE